MKYLLIALLSFSTQAEVSFELAHNKTQMQWLGISHAKYNYNLKTIGFVWFDDDVGVRVSYGRGKNTLPNDGAAHKRFMVELKHAIDFEVLYRYELYDSIYVVTGLGYYMDNLPVTSNTDDYYHNDWDRGWGYSLGFDYKLNPHLSIQATYRVRADVGAAKDDSGALGSTHKSIGISFRYTL